VETLLRKQNLLPEKQKCFLANSETFDVSLCFSLMFPSVCPLWETWRNIDRKQCFRNNVSEFAQGLARELSKQRFCQHEHNSKIRITNFRGILHRSLD
jgi:hypothetical protein